AYVIVYCKSGNRSKKALKLLNDLGYENVYDLGAISNWKD
ncbi:rhodanese-like domain-containing protein, partial [Salmonella enterica subsp. enterica serovar Mbandaka]|nr:rhodanese-like domain-containing protein [Salmonella enterica subsp. enterica serovar Mbandaka]